MWIINARLPGPGIVYLPSLIGIFGAHCLPTLALPTTLSIAQSLEPPYIFAAKAPNLPLLIYCRVECIQLTRMEFRHLHWVQYFTLRGPVIIGNRPPQHVLSNKFAEIIQQLNPFIGRQIKQNGNLRTRSYKEGGCPWESVLLKAGYSQILFSTN